MCDKHPSQEQRTAHISPLGTTEFYHELSRIAKQRQMGLAQMERMVVKKRSPLYACMTRIMDIVLSGFGLVISAIPSLVIAVVIKIDSPGPVFYRQRRIGKDDKCFKIVKFRTMRVDAEKRTGPVWAKEDDPRLTRVGRFLKQTKLDELPQLFNIFLGSMTFVGPRPERLEFVHQFTQYLPAFNRRHEVKPGLTGLAQLRNGYDRSAADIYRKLRWDIYYIQRKCLRTDLDILYRTFRYLLTAFKHSR